MAMATVSLVTVPASTHVGRMLSKIVGCRLTRLYIAAPKLLGVAKPVTNVAPTMARVLFENDRVKVIELNMKKG